MAKRSSRNNQIKRQKSFFFHRLAAKELCVWFWVFLLTSRGLKGKKKRRSALPVCRLIAQVVTNKKKRRSLFCRRCLSKGTQFVECFSAELRVFFSGRLVWTALRTQNCLPRSINES